MAEYNGSDQLQRTYVTPGLDQNLSLTSSGSTYYYLSDALGRVRQVISANEATQTRSGGTPRGGLRPHSYDYYAFGKVYGTPTENLTQPFRFTGRAWDSETELYYYRARNYAPTVGRLRGRDPILAFSSPNLYTYVRNRPNRWIDPLGLRIIIPDDPDHPSFPAEVASALQRVIGDCADVRLRAHTTGWLLQRIDYWEIYPANVRNTRQCCCNPCVTGLREAISSPGEIRAHWTRRTDNAGMRHDWNVLSSNDADIYINPNINVALPVIDPSAPGGEDDEPARFDVVLWHEGLGHGNEYIHGRD